MEENNLQAQVLSSLIINDQKYDSEGEQSVDFEQISFSPNFCNVVAEALREISEKYNEEAQNQD